MKKENDTVYVQTMKYSIFLHLLSETPFLFHQKEDYW
jgi:hypothetical protein